MYTNNTSIVPGVVEDKDEPKKYIRTFARDMEILKKGGVPDLAPFVSDAPAPVAAAAPAAPAAEPEPAIVVAEEPVPPPLPEPAPIEIPLPSVEEERVEPPPPPPPAYIPEPVIQAPQPVSPPPPSAPIETYASDFADEMKKTHASTATVVAAEQDARGVPKMAAQEPAPFNANILYIVGGVLFVIAGGVGAYYAYAHYAASNAPVAIDAAVPSPIFVDSRADVSGEGQKLMQEIEQSLSAPVDVGTVRLLNLASATTTDVFSALQLPAPGILTRNINVNGSIAGIVNAGGNQSPFFVLSVSSYSSTFAGMLSWEKNMPDDLSALFPAYAPIVVPVPAAATTAATTTVKKSTKAASTTPSIPVPVAAPAVQIGFKDETVNNHDVRIYRDQAGRSIIVYGYWNQSTLVIARDPSAFTEILRRLATSRAQ